jgi:hypothetical protein
MVKNFTRKRMANMFHVKHLHQNFGDEILHLYTNRYCECPNDY